jgi:7-cyano-7-deazaguanine synthase in queuosine biosynthesis
MNCLARQQSEYILLFDSLQDNGSTVRWINRATGDARRVRISIDDHEFKHRIQQEFPSVIADVIDLAVAIHASDRLTLQDPRQPQIQLKVVIPIRHPEIMNQSSLNQQLCELLQWATGKKWIFEFERRSQPGRCIENEHLLWSSDPDVAEVSLWSGGLDALAGLYTRLKQSPANSFALFGSGSNDNNHDRQQHVFHGLHHLFPNRLDLCRTPIRFDKSGHIEKNPFSRARGIVFMLLGSAYAYLRGLRVLHVYENGIGAINLPYRKSAVGLDHTRSVHPEALRGVGLLMSELIGENFKVHNPFLFKTKTEMIKALAEDAHTELIPLTSSCDSPHRKPQQPTQCGYCSSCILRKQALAASQVEDKTQYIEPHGNPPVKDIRLYLESMLAQVATLRERLKHNDRNVDQWRSLTQRFPELNDIADRTHTEEDITLPEMRFQLIHLLRSYVSEWDRVEPTISEQFRQRGNSYLADQESPFIIGKDPSCQ